MSGADCSECTLEAAGVFAASVLGLWAGQRVQRNYLRRKCIELYSGSGCPKEHRDAARRIVLLSDYSPSPYAYLDYHGQLQTAVQFLVRNAARLAKWCFLHHALIQYRREELVLSDGGTVALDWAYNSSCDRMSRCPTDPVAPIVVLFHGLCGDSQAEYIIHMAWQLLTEGYRVVVLVARGCGGLKLTTMATFTGDQRIHDIHEALYAVRTKYPEAAKLFWVGYSLGAANTLKYLSSELYNKAIENCTERYKDDEDRGTRYYEDHRDHRKCVIDAAVCVSPPWNLVNNNTPVFSLWSRLLVLPLKVYSLTHHRMLRGFQEMYPELSIFTLLTARDITHFDSLFYRTYGNYNSVQEYYEKASPIHSVNQIHCHTPTLAISAKDDPICGHVDCPTDPDQLGSGIIVVKTPFGGHLAFPEGIVALTDAWTDRVAIQWFNHFRNNSNLHSGSYRLMNTISDVKLPPAQGEDVTVCSNSSDERASGLK